MGRWRPPRYDVGAGRHIPDPDDATRCLCGHAWDQAPTPEEWQEHKYGPEADSGRRTPDGPARGQAGPAVRYQWYSE
jgi:hypothetical protein